MMCGILPGKSWVTKTVAQTLMAGIRGSGHWYQIYAIMGKTDVNDEKLMTAMIGQSANPSDDIPLTPNYFSRGQLTPSSFDETDSNTRKNGVEYKSYCATSERDACANGRWDSTLKCNYSGHSETSKLVMSCWSFLQTRLLGTGRWDKCWRCIRKMMEEFQLQRSRLDKGC